MHEDTEPKVEYSFDKSRLQLAVIHGFLTTSYWSPGIGQEIVREAISHSLTMGAYLEGHQVGFARLITDYATFGYLADVFVLPASRGRGIAREMVSKILDRPDVQKFRRLMLATKDAHGVYERCGFERVADASAFMQILRPNAYQAGPS